jgi:hypothetical protein
VCFSFYHLGK